MKDYILWRLDLKDAKALLRQLAGEVESLTYDADGTADEKLGFNHRIATELEITIDHKDDEEAEEHKRLGDE